MKKAPFFVIVLLCALSSFFITVFYRVSHRPQLDPVLSSMIEGPTKEKAFDNRIEIVSLLSWPLGLGCFISLLTVSLSAYSFEKKQ